MFDLVDILFIVTIVLLVFNGLRNGAVFSLFNLLSLPAGYIVAKLYGPQFTALLASNNLSVTPLISYIVLFFATVLVIHIIGTVVRGVVEQVLRDGEIEIERARLKDHAETAQRLRRFARDIEAEHGDRAALCGVEPRDEREQRRLAGAVEPKQHGESPLLHVEADIVECAPLAIGMAAMGDTIDRPAKFPAEYSSDTGNHCLTTSELATIL